MNKIESYKTDMLEIYREENERLRAEIDKKDKIITKDKQRIDSLKEELYEWIDEAVYYYCYAGWGQSDGILDRAKEAKDKHRSK